MRFKKRTKFKERKKNFVENSRAEKGYKIVYSRNDRTEYADKENINKTKITISSKNFQNNFKNNQNNIKNFSTDSPKKKEVPWIKNKTLEYSGVLKLHHEILDFYQFIKPKEEETQKRHDTITLLKKLINYKWPHWKIKIFGSFPNDLHLPNSDIDVVIFKQESINLKNLYNFANDSNLSDTTQLQLIYRELLMKSFVSEIRFVNAKVPIIKAVCKQTGVNLDIS